VTSSLQLDEIFENLAHQAYDLTGEKGGIASFATITLVEGNQTILKAAYPLSEEENIIGANVAKIDLDEGVNGRIGIIGRAVKNKAPLLVKDVENHPDFLRANQHTKCELAVPIIYQDEVVGIINIEHKKIGGLDEEDLQDIQSLAAHAAVAIQNARMYQALQRKSQHQQAIYEASKIINANMELTQKELLDLLVEQIVTKIVPAAGAMNILGAILLYNDEKKELKLECTYPKAAFGTHRINEIRSLINPPEGKIGITGRAALEKKPQRVDDVTRVDQYLNYSKDTKSELDVPMLEGKTVLGVLSLECDQLNGFDKDAENALCAFAELAAIAIQNTRRYQELKETRATVGNITAVAWMGLVAGAWRHTIGNMATTISDLSELAQKDLEKGEATEKIKQRLNKIQGIVEELQNIPMPPLSSEDGVEPVCICHLVRDRINQFRKKHRYGDTQFEITFEIEELSTVRASPEWLRRILDILIDNASDAMRGCQLKRINTFIGPRNEGVEILISDTGTGIPNHHQSILFNKPIHKAKKEKGSGIGLFLANSIIQVYGGRLEIRSTGPDGTTMALWLPLLK
jgi:GAF domain-containing protein